MLLGKSVLLLLGGLVIGAIAGDVGTAPIKAVFIDPFKGVLALFLLELGLVAGGRLAEVRRFGGAVLLIGLGAPPLLALAGVAVGIALGLSTGGVALLATLAASASYIAAPTAMRIAVPEANAALSITAALGITFPFNIVIGIPLYIALAQRSLHEIAKHPKTLLVVVAEAVLGEAAWRATWRRTVRTAGRWARCREATCKACARGASEADRTVELRVICSRRSPTPCAADVMPGAAPPAAVRLALYFGEVQVLRPERF